MLNLTIIEWDELKFPEEGKTIGSGGEATVYKAKWAKEFRNVAVRCLRNAVTHLIRCLAIQSVPFCVHSLGNRLSAK